MVESGMTMDKKAPEPEPEVDLMREEWEKKLSVARNELGGLNHRRIDLERQIAGLQAALDQSQQVKEVGPIG